MIFDNVIEQIQESEKETEVVVVKLGEVSSVTPGGRAYVKLYGDGAPSTKLYTYIDGYFPETGDKVALIPQGKTYIILGKVNDKDPVDFYAKIKWVEENFLTNEYKNKLEDAIDESENLSFSGYSLIPTTDDRDILGSATKNFKEIFVNKLTLDGESFTKIYQDRIFVVNSGTTYSLIATYSSGVITLTPSTDDAWALGTSSAKFKEIWVNSFRGNWKSGQTTERYIYWNSANAIVPDTDNSVDIGRSSLRYKLLYAIRMIGAYSYSSNSNYIKWDSGTNINPNVTDTVDLGSEGKQFNNIYAKKFFLNGTEIDISSITTDKLVTKYGTTDYTLDLSVVGGGSSSQYEKLEPSVNNKFDLGSASYKFRDIYVNAWTNGTRDISFDSNHNIFPDATNAVSLGTSSKQYKNIYGQNIYVNGTAVVSDRRKKKDFGLLDKRYELFFEHLNPVSFKYKDDDEQRHTGFIAQEVEEAARQCCLEDTAIVVHDKDDNYYLRYEELVAIQTKIIKELMADIAGLEAKNRTLEARLEKIEKFLFEN